MNVMAQAHKDCKARIVAGNPNRYADLFRVALRQAHKKVKAMQTPVCQAAFRNLYKITNDAGKVVAHITAATDFAAIDRYTVATQDFKEVKAERQSIGYPEDVCKIY